MLWNTKPSKTHREGGHRQVHEASLSKAEALYLEDPPCVFRDAQVVDHSAGRAQTKRRAYRNGNRHPRHHCCCCYWWRCRASRRRHLFFSPPQALFLLCQEKAPPAKGLFPRRFRRKTIKSYCESRIKAVSYSVWLIIAYNKSYRAVKYIESSIGWFTCENEATSIREKGLLARGNW